MYQRFVSNGENCVRPTTFLHDLSTVDGTELDLFVVLIIRNVCVDDVIKIVKGKYYSFTSYLRNLLSHVNVSIFIGIKEKTCVHHR